MIEKQYIIKLLHLPCIDRRTVRKIISRIDFNISCDADLFGVVKSLYEEFKFPSCSSYDIDKCISESELMLEKSEKKSVKIISCFDDEYPLQLKITDDYPLLLNYMGNLSSINNKKNIAIVGTRQPTDYGEKEAMRLGEIFAGRGFNVVGGLAAGCDTAAHNGAIRNNGTTAAVLAHGLGTVYPDENRGLAERILAHGGVLLTEYFFDREPLPSHFIERDRIQAGLSSAVLVVETELEGSTMHTAGFCLDYDRILACVDHPREFLNPTQAQGNRYLLNEKNAFKISDRKDIESLLDMINNKS